MTNNMTNNQDIQAIIAWIISPNTIREMRKIAREAFRGLDHDIIEEGLNYGLFRAVRAADSFAAQDMATAKNWLKTIIMNAIREEYRKDAAWRGLPARQRRSLRQKGIDDDIIDLSIEPSPKLLVFADLVHPDANEDDDPIEEIIGNLDDNPEEIINNQEGDDDHQLPPIIVLTYMEPQALSAALAWTIHTGQARGWEKFVEAFLKKGHGYAYRQSQRVKAAASIHHQKRSKSS